MKNKTLFKQRAELIEQLLEAVNSPEEFNYLKSEMASLFYFYTDERRCKE